MDSWKIQRSYPKFVSNTSVWFKNGQKHRLMEFGEKRSAYAKVYPCAETQDVSVCEALLAAVANKKRVQLRVADNELLVGIEGDGVILWQGAGEIPEEALKHVGECSVSRFGIEFTDVGSQVNRSEVMGAADDMMMDLMSDEEVDQFTDVMVGMMSSWIYVISIELQGVE